MGINRRNKAFSAVNHPLGRVLLVASIAATLTASAGVRAAVQTITGVNGTASSPNGGNATANASAPADTTNKATAIGGNGYGGASAATVGSGGYANSYSLTDPVGGSALGVSSSAYAQGGQGGAENGAGSGGVGGGAKAAASATNAGAGATTVNANATGGNGGQARGSGYVGGGGGFANFNSGSSGSSAAGSVMVIANGTGGNGGQGLSGANGGSGGSSIITNAVTGATLGQLTLTQIATGGNSGGAVGGGNTGSAGNGVSNLNFTQTDTASAPRSLLIGNSEAFAGSGGDSGSATSPGAAFGSAGFATAEINLSNINNVDATATANNLSEHGSNVVSGAGTAGNGNTALATAAASSTGDGGDAIATADARGSAGGSVNSNNVAGSGGAGGNATAQATATNPSLANTIYTMDQTVTANANAAGGAGGQGQGAGNTGGNGGSASVNPTFGSSIGGGYVRVTASVTGGNGGFGNAGAGGGNGGNVSVSNAVAGATIGQLTLSQIATGGNSGGANGQASAGIAGNADSALTLLLPSTTPASEPSTFIGNSQAYAGNGGNGSGGNAVAGSANAAIDISGASVNATATANNGLQQGGNVSSGGGAGGYGNFALANATGLATGGPFPIDVGVTSGLTTAAATGSSGYAYVTANATGSNGGNVINSGVSGRGGGGGSAAAQATGGNTSLTNALQHPGQTVIATANATGGNGGQGQGSGNHGGAGGNASVNHTSGYSTTGGSVSVIANEIGGNGGGGLASANGGNGANASLSSIGLDTDAVSGSTTGVLTLTQTATGGASGGTNGGSDAGTPGDASTTMNLSYPASAGAVDPATVIGNSIAWAGNGGASSSVANPVANFGQAGKAAAEVNLTNVGNAVADAMANNGLQHGSDITGGGGNGGNGNYASAVAAATSTGASGYVRSAATAVGSDGGGVFNNLTLGNGGAGGAADAESAGTSASVSSTSYYPVTATASADGGGGGRGQGVGNSGGDGGSANIYATSGTSTGGGNVIVNATVNGGGGGAGYAGANGGNGAYESLSNAVTGQATNGAIISLTQNVTGGNGGAASGGGNGGTGGAANSALVNVLGSEGESFSLIANATGGAGGGVLAGAGVAANGGNATTEVSGKTNGTINVLATATGGLAGQFPSGTTSNSAGSLDGTSMAVGFGSGASGSVVTTASSGSGELMLNGRIFNNTAAVVARASAPVVSAGTAADSFANGNQLIENPNYSTGLQAASFATAMPLTADSVAALANNPTVRQNFAVGGTSDVLGLALAATDSLSSTASQTYHSETDWQINLSSLPSAQGAQDLVVGLLGATTIGNGSVHFQIQQNGSDVVNQTFTSFAAAAAYFNDNTLDLGAIGSGVVKGQNLGVNFLLDVTSAQANAVFSTNLILGNSDGNLVVNSGQTFATNSFAETSVLDNGVLTVFTSATDGAITSFTKALTIGASGALNLNNTNLVIHYGTNPSPVQTIQRYLTSGYNGGAWTGLGINSAAAAASHGVYSLGYADGADGVVAGLAPGDLLIKYTLAGDADMDGKVDFNDFLILESHFGQSGMQWDQGNFTYGNTVNFADFLLLETNFGKSLPGMAAVQITSAQLAAINAFANSIGAPSVSQTSIPEPATLGLVALGALALARRRKSKPPVT